MINISDWNWSDPVDLFCLQYAVCAAGAVFRHTRIILLMYGR